MPTAFGTFGVAGHYGHVPTQQPLLVQFEPLRPLRAAGFRQSHGVAAGAEAVCLKVQYLCDPKNPASECWTFLSLRRDLEGAIALARDGFPDVSAHLGARGFRILDNVGWVVAEEWMGSPPEQAKR
jgi:hypothetical protein